MSVLQQIVEWSRSRPLWQRDALRRLVSQTTLTEQDYDQLLLICKQQRGVETLGVPTISPRPLGESDIPQPGSSSSTLKLRALRNLRAVNAISTESPLSFSASGLTVIYGDNATGKSGYVRLLKQVCRARGASDPILPNVFDAASEVPAEADIDYLLNDSEVSLHWSSGSTAPAQFKEVSIFDELSAGVYVDENCEIAYLPFGLDLLPRLADVCNEVARRIRLEIAQLNSNQFFPVGIPLGTQASSIVERLDQRDIQGEIVRFAAFGPDEQRRLDEITLTLSRLTAESPQTRAAELRARASRFQTLRQTFETYLGALADQRIADFREAIRLHRSREAAATFAHTQAFSEEPLPGIGTDTWRTLWEAARQYSELHAHQGVVFPPTFPGELCVLCLQPLEQPAIERFQRFEHFVRATVQAEADRARQAVDQLREVFQTLQATPFLPADTFDELNAVDPLSADALRASHDNILTRRAQAVSADLAESLDNLAPLPNPPLPWLADLENRARNEAAALSSAGNPTERDRLAREQNELIGKRRLADDREQLLTEVRRRTRRAALAGCFHDTDTTGITRRNTDLTDSALISVLAQRFSTHLQALRVQHTLASISRGPGEHGTASHRVEIRARRPVRASEILSRGEHRAVALAAFLAELETQQSTSTIVFDDPVSSLDQDRRRYVATSLISSATQRPVVVFTHDLFFLYLLREQARDSGIELTPRFLSREAARVGIVSEGFPWPGQNVSERIGVLRQRGQQAAALFRRGQNGEYERDAKEIYGLLREAWERAVEEILFNGAVTRFSPDVQTKRLSNLWGLDQNMLVRLDNGMAKSSRWLTGHDTPITAVEPVPDANELEADILEFDNWVREIRQHHQRARRS